MKYNTLKRFILFLTLPLGTYAQAGNNNNQNDHSRSDEQEHLSKVVEAWKDNWKRVITAKVSSYHELEAAIEALQPIDEESLTVLGLQQKDLNSALFLASRVGNAFAVAALLQAGADVHARDRFNQSPLHWAAANGGDLDVAKFLVEHGAVVNARDSKGKTPLCWAANGGDLAMVTFLVERGAVVNARDNEGRIPLHWAAEECDLAIVAFLVEHGADVNARDNEGDTPLHWAKVNDCKNVVAFLSNWVPHARTNNNNNNNDTILIEDAINEDPALIDVFERMNEVETPLNWTAAFLRSFLLYIKKTF
jgi:ankyrin repeat protein